ncbi:MAG: hypothetical protein JSS57_21885 [Proteobacteria bacterium]|nr:hypothetical protein [Pseudomonadota bacterium]
MSRVSALLVLKLCLTVPVALGLGLPFVSPPPGGGVLRELAAFGIPGSLAIGALFLSLVFLYCQDLHTTLSLIHPRARAASPRSVWLMFLVPYSFIEDFFIVLNVTRSLQRESSQNAVFGQFRNFGMLSGIGWCSAQLISLLPNDVGLIGGLMALPLWILHWRRIRQANSLLSTHRGFRRSIRASSPPAAVCPRHGQFVGTASASTGPSRTKSAGGLRQ